MALQSPSSSTSGSIHPEQAGPGCQHKVSDYCSLKPAGLCVWPKDTGPRVTSQVQTDWHFSCQTQDCWPSAPHTWIKSAILFSCENRRFELRARRALEISLAIQVHSQSGRTGRMFAMSFRKRTKSLLMWKWENFLSILPSVLGFATWISKSCIKIVTLHFIVFQMVQVSNIMIPAQTISQKCAQVFYSR